MPSKMSPEYQRAYRARCKAEGRPIEREELRKHIRRLQDETVALQASLARQEIKDKDLEGFQGLPCFDDALGRPRQTVKDSFRGMESK